MPCEIDYINPRNDGSGPGCPEFCVKWPLTFDNVTGVVVDDQWSDLTQGFGLFLIIFTFLVVPITITVFVFTMQRTYLERRGIVLIGLMTVGIFMPVIAVEFREYVGRQNFSCLLFLFTQLLAFPLFLFSFSTRTILLYNRYKYKALQAEYWQQVAFLKSENVFPKALEAALGRSEIRRPKRRTGSQVRRVTQRDVERSKYYCSERFGLQLNITLTLFALLFLTIHTLARPEKYGKNCLGCEDDLAEILFLALLDSITCVSALYALYLVKDESDPLEIISELRWAFFWNVVIVQPAFLLHVIDPGDLVKDGIWEWGHFIIVGLLMMYLTSVPYQVYKAFKVEVKFKFEDNETRLLDVLNNDDARLCFSTYLISEFSSENCYFWKAATEWRTSFEEKKSEERLDEARQLYELFIRHGAPMELNISATTHENLAAVFEEKEGTSEKEVNSNVFDRAVNEVFRLMEDDTFGRFLQSDLFKTYQAVEGNQDLLLGNQVKQFSKSAQKANEWVNTKVTQLSDRAGDAVKALSERAVVKKKPEEIGVMNLKDFYEGEDDETIGG